MIYFNLPDLGEGLQEAEITTWHVHPGDEVESDQVLLAVETAKTIVDLPSPQAGKILHLFGKVGEIIHVGDPLVEFANHNETADSGTVVGEIPEKDMLVSEPAMTVNPEAVHSVKATPAVRALATRLHVDLSLVKPSGKNNSIVAKDIHRVAKLIKSSGDMLPLDSVRRSMAISMMQAHTEVAAASLYEDADIDDWRINEDISMRLIRAIVAACKAEPALNAWYDNHAQARILHQQVHLGIAIDTEHGLFVPVLKDVAQVTPQDLRSRFEQLKQHVIERSIAAEQMRGHTITLSNFGSIAGRYATPVVVPPSVAIVAAGKVRSQAVLIDQQLQNHNILPLSLSFDHRAVTGGEAARFLQVIQQDLQCAS